MLIVTSRRHLELLEEQLARKDARIAELERQVDELHRQGYTITAPPPPAAPAVEMTDALRDLVEGLEDAEARASWRAEAQRRLAAGESADHVARTLFL